MWLHHCMWVQFACAYSSTHSCLSLLCKWNLCQDLLWSPSVSLCLCLFNDHPGTVYWNEPLSQHGYISLMCALCLRNKPMKASNKINKSGPGAGYFFTSRYEAYCSSQPVILRYCFSEIIGIIGLSTLQHPNFVNIEACFSSNRTVYSLYTLFIIAVSVKMFSCMNVFSGSLQMCPVEFSSGDFL